MSKITVILMSVLMMVGLTACTTNKDGSSISTPAASYSASQLAQKIEDGEDLKGSVIEVTGVVTNVSGNEIKLDQEIKYGFYICDISKNDLDISNLEVGNTATITGKITNTLGNITLSDCRVVSFKDTPPPAIINLEFSDNLGYELEKIGDTATGWVTVNTDTATIDDLDIVIDSYDYVRVTWGNQTSKHIWYNIEALSSGSTSFYIQTKDGSVKTDTKTIVVK